MSLGFNHTGYTKPALVMQVLRITNRVNCHSAMSLFCLYVLIEKDIV